MNSILTPEPWVQYLQWINYAFLFIPISMYIGIYGHEDTKLKLYKLSPYLIALNLIQTMVNLLPYKESLFLGMNLFGNISLVQEVFDFNDSAEVEHVAGNVARIRH